MKGKKLLKLLRTPLRILIRVRDLYIKSLTECSGSHAVGFGSIMGCPTGQINALPRSFSVNSTRSSIDEDFRELVRVASARSSLRSSDPSDIWNLPSRHERRQSPSRLARSYSTRIGSIDEEKPCEFEANNEEVKASLFPRSRSYAVNRRNAFV